MNTPISFKLAQLLTHTEFNQKNAERGYIIATGEESSDYFMDMLNAKAIAAPTVSEVLMWLYEKHAIWIRITPLPYSDTLTHWRWEHMSTSYATRSLNWKKKQDYMSPKEAYEAGIEYTLTKLI
jgi:hypothetical protein